MIPTVLSDEPEFLEAIARHIVNAPSLQRRDYEVALAAASRAALLVEKPSASLRRFVEGLRRQTRGGGAP